MPLTASPLAPKRRAFSLMEALVTMALVGLVLALFTSLLKMLTSSSHSMDTRDQLVTGTLAGLERMGRDLKMGVAWTTPAVSDTSLQTTLEFDVPDYENDATRMPAPVPGMAATPAWNPLSPGGLRHIRYRVAQGSLLREVQVGASYDSVALAGQVVGLSAQRTDQQEISLTLSVQTGQTLQQLNETVRLPLQQCWRTP